MYRSLIPVMVPFHESETPVGPRLYVYSRKQPQTFKYSILDAVPPIHAESSHVATDKVPSK